VGQVPLRFNGSRPAELPHRSPASNARRPQCLQICDALFDGMWVASGLIPSTGGNRPTPHKGE
jgi:hypothetical protein